MKNAFVLLLARPKTRFENRRNRHLGDFTHWKDHDQKAFDRLLRDLNADALSGKIAEV